MKHTPTLAGVHAYSADRVFDGQRLLTSHAVVVEGGIVSGVVPLASLDPGMARRHEPGATILPGLIDAHVHFMRWQGPLFLAHGVTTVRDTGNRLDWVLDRRREWPERLWPRLLCVGPLLDGPTPIHRYVSRPCADLAEAVAAVRETTAAGVDAIKLYVGLDPEWLPAMVRESHAAGCKASMHCAGGGALIAGRAGVDEFFHLDGLLDDLWPGHPPGWLDAWGLPEFARTWDRQREVADAIRALGLAATPTLAYWDSQWRAREPCYATSEELRHVPAAMVQWQAAAAPDPAGSARWRAALEAAQRFVGLLLERGGPVLAGTDVPCGAVPPGLSLWRELSLLAEAGMPPLEALGAATSGAAAFLERPDLGRLGSGAVADLVVVRGNPAERIPASPEVALVVRGGVAHSSEDLLAVAASEATPPDEDPWGQQFRAHWEARGAPGVQTPG
jgi:hypothetical protein